MNFDHVRDTVWDIWTDCGRDTCDPRIIDRAVVSTSLDANTEREWAFKALRYLGADPDDVEDLRREIARHL